MPRNRKFIPTYSDYHKENKGIKSILLKNILLELNYM